MEQMDWESKLIALYLQIVEHFKTTLWVSCQRQTNGGYKRCTDEEIMTLYLFGLLMNFRDIKSIHNYAQAHLKAYVPQLPQYGGFVHRVNRLSEAYRMLLEIMQSQRVTAHDNRAYLIDSFPISLAKGQHAYKAKVAPIMAGKSYNATKKMYYYGVKAHVVARCNQGGLPELELLVIDSANRQDGPVFDQLRQTMHNNCVYGDKAYKRPDAEHIELEQNLKVITPVIKVRGQKELTPQQADFSTVVAKIRQPIEALFSWIQRKTGIQDAGFVRSAAGLATHIFARLAAALICKAHPHLDS
jgi:hypothetical protein